MVQWVHDWYIVFDSLHSDLLSCNIITECYYGVNLQIVGGVGFLNCCVTKVIRYKSFAKKYILEY